MVGELPNLGAHPDAKPMLGTGRRRQVRSNSRDYLLMRALGASNDVDCTAGGTITLTLEQMWASATLRLTGTPGAAFTLELADGNRDIAIENTTGQTATIDTATGAASPPTLVAGETKEFQERGVEIITTGINGVQVGAMMADGSVSPTALIDFADNILAKAKLKDTGLTVTSPSSSSGTLTLDMVNGNAFDVTLTEDVTTLDLDNPPTTGDFGTIILIARQDDTGTWDITWPASVIWERDTGESPAQTTTADAVDIYALMTPDAGTTWYGLVLGLDMG